MKYYHIITCFLLFLTLSSCTDYQEHPHDGIDLTGAWVLRHVKFPSGTEQKYAMDNDGTSCLIYDHNNMLYECNISTTPTGLIIQPTAKSTVTLIDKGNGEWLYLENGDPHPLHVTDSTITIQRIGILYTWHRDNTLYNEWGADIRDIIVREYGNPEAENIDYVQNAFKPAVSIKKSKKRHNIVYYILPFLSIFISLRQIIINNYECNYWKKT